MDPYEYLLSKLNVIIIPKFTTSSMSIYIKLETGKKLISNMVSINRTHEQIFKYYRNTFSNDFLRQYHKDIEGFCHLLQQFPDELESIEHVDLLLTLHGMNKGA